MEAEPSASLHRSEQLLSALLESAAQAILAVNHSGTIVLANRRTEEMFGYTRRELLGAPLEQLLPQSSRGVHCRQRDDYFAHPHARPMGIGMDLAGRRKDGVEFPVEVSLSFVNAPEGGFAIAFISDISQRKTLESQLLQAEKMEAVGRLAGGVAHDFNNMLTVISGYDRMILDELPPGDPLRAYAEQILKAADRAAGLTSQMLAFSRRQLMQPQIVNVNTVIRQMEEMLRSLVGEYVQVSVRLSESIGSIKADPNQIERAIVNLVLNARDAMPTGGRLSIETGNTRLDENYMKTHMGVKPGEFVMIAVTDDGHGMDPATRQHIFEPFFTTKDVGKGTGLGLSMVYGMVKQGGGDIWVYTEPGQGTTFKLYFPRVEEAPTETPALEPEEEIAPGTGTILLVEDEKAVRELTSHILQQLGYTVLVAADGEEAIQIADSYVGTVSLLVTDVVMPGMSGRQVADALMASRPGLKVLYLSGYTEHTIIHHGVLNASVDFLPKPFTREVLARKIREILAVS